MESDLINYPALSNISWHTSNVTNDDSILSKYNSNGNLVWQTYVPENLDSDFFIKTDNMGNIYIAGTTKWQNLGDLGTYEPSFTYVSSPQGDPVSNSYVVKLNSQGQKSGRPIFLQKQLVILIYLTTIYILLQERILILLFLH